MRKYIIILILTAVSSVAYGQVVGQEGNDVSVSNNYAGIHMKEYLKLMPDSILPLLTSNNILDCIDFMESGQVSDVLNRMQGKSRMTHLTDDYARIEQTTHSVVTFKLLPKGDDGVLIYMITTTHTDSLYDSHVSVYQPDWGLAPQANQYVSEHPERFTELTVFPDNSTMQVLEVEPRTLFEGELESARPQKQNEWILQWNSSKGVFEKK